jgi:hypothetical protein
MKTKVAAVVVVGVVSVGLVGLVVAAGLPVWAGMAVASLFWAVR